MRTTRTAGLSSVALFALAGLAVAQPQPTPPTPPTPPGAPGAPAVPPAPAKPPSGKGPFPCGAKVLPLNQGNEWTYTPITPPTPAPKEIERIAPQTPTKIVITVKSVETKGADTVVTLEEKMTYDTNRDLKKSPVLVDHTVTSTIVCGAKKFEISPQSFFFAGEPGGMFGLELSEFQRPKGTSLTLTGGGIGEGEWREDIIAKWARTPTQGTEAQPATGKLELERKVVPNQPEKVITKQWSFMAEKLVITTTGRVTLDAKITADLKPMELPANWVSQIWLVDNLGVVQTLNSFAHMYQLADAKLK